MRIALFFLALFSLSSLIAQDTPKKIEIGFGGGLNYSFMSGATQYSGNQIALPGFQSGLGAKVYLNRNFFLTGQVSYIKQSTKYSSAPSTYSSGATFEMTSSFSWMAMPIQLNYLMGGKTKNFFFGLGFSPRRSLSAKEDLQTTWSSGAAAVNSSVSDRTNDWNIFSTAQTGMRFPLKQGGSILVLVSYERNISNLQKPLPTSPTFNYIYDDSSAKLNSFSLGLSYYY